MSTDPVNPDPSPETDPKKESGSFLANTSPRVLWGTVGAVVVVLVAIVLIVALAGGGSDADTAQTSGQQQAGVKPGPPPVQTVSGTLLIVDAAGAKDAKAKVAGRKVSLWTMKNGKPDRETQTAVTGGTGTFFFLKTDTVKPGAKFIIKADKGDPITVTIPDKGSVKTTLKVCYSCS